MRLNRRTSAAAVSALVAALAVPTAAHADTTATVTGTVTTGGTVVAGLPVSFVTTGGDSIGGTSAGDDGTFSLQVPVGTTGWVELGEEDYGKTQDQTSVPTVVKYVGADPSTAGAYTRMSAPRTVSGDVALGGVAVDQPGELAGTGAGYGQVTLLTLGGSPAAYVSAQTNGDYDLTGIVPGRYRLDIQPGYRDTAHLETVSGVVTVKAGPEVTTFSPALKAAAVVRGHVTVGGKKPAAAVSVTGFEGEAYAASTSSAPKTGAYALGGLSASKYAVSFTAASTASSMTFVPVTRSVKLKAGQHRTLNVDLDRGGRVTGSLPKAASGARVLVERADGTIVASAMSSKTRFTVSGIAAGRYRVLVASATKYGVARVTVRDGRKAAVGTLKLTHAALTLHGRISSHSAGSVALTTSDGTYLGQAQTSSSGSYAMKGLVPGAYRVYASADTTGGETDVVLKKSRRLDLDAGDELGSASVVLHDAAATSGRLEFDVTGPDGYEDIRSATAGSPTTLTYLAPGTYRVHWAIPSSDDGLGGPIWLAAKGSTTFVVHPGTRTTASFDLTAHYGD